ncbi:MAG: hypothetical protein Unbinned4409contig1002_59 [Prokaryotic dsDNA virus sp.]|nr:MAG: hypothetical protein Unbinned4409contig1002_59 [Prokaryotic dsDNA virus sp.]
MIRNRNYSRTRIDINAGQLLTKGLHDTIMLEAQQAMAYLPAEDKINMALALVAAPKIDDANSVTAMAVSLKEKLEEANDVIATLQAQVTANSSAIGTATP